MGKSTFEICMTLDGFITASNQTPEEPLGAGGEQPLHGWGLDPDETNRVWVERHRDLGAYICGRRMYDHSLPWWGANGPSGRARKPVFVVTHEAPADHPPDGVYTYVTDGIDSALKQAQDAAGDKEVCVMGGADVGRQYIAAGLLDEIVFHVVPVLFGTGTPMFEDLHQGHVRLEVVDVVATPTVTHLTYRVA